MYYLKATPTDGIMGSRYEIDAILSKAGTAALTEKVAELVDKGLNGTASVTELLTSFGHTPKGQKLIPSQAFRAELGRLRAAMKSGELSTDEGERALCDAAVAALRSKVQERTIRETFRERGAKAAA